MSELSNRNISCEKKIKEYLKIELDNAAKYTFNKNFLVDLMMKSDAFRNSELIFSIHQLIKNKFMVLQGIIEEGIEKGEFRKTDPKLATISVMGAINFFISIDYAPFDSGELFSGTSADWNREEFLDLLLNGLMP